MFHQKLKVTKGDNMINDLGIALDEFKENNNHLCILKTSSQAQATELQASADKAVAKLTIRTGCDDTFREKKAAGIRQAQEGVKAKMLAIDNERSADVAPVKLGFRRRC
jgi:hypothetical protein